MTNAIPPSTCLGRYEIKSQLGAGGMGLVYLAEEYGKSGQPSEGLAVIADALALVERSEERCWEADIYRVKGELLLGAGRGHV